jgi:hypothetical protein
MFSSQRRPDRLCPPPPAYYTIGTGGSFLGDKADDSPSTVCLGEESVDLYSYSRMFLHGVVLN